MKDKIKTHVKKYKTVYCCAATGIVVAGITGVIMRGRYAGVLRVPDGPVRVTVRPFSFFSKQMNDVTTVIHRGGTGSPSFVVECIETGEGWLSQHGAALAKGVSDAVMSGHLTGKLPDVNGLHYRRIGIATA